MHKEVSDKFVFAYNKNIPQIESKLNSEIYIYMYIYAHILTDG